jgi:WD40 repeat protein
LFDVNELRFRGVFHVILAIGAVACGFDAHGEERAISVASVRVISMPTDVESRTAPIVSAVRIHPRGNVLATAGDDHVIRFWDLATGNQLRSFPGHQDWIDTVCFSPDGKLLATAGHDRRVFIWNVTRGVVIRELTEPDEAVSSLTFSHDGSLLAVAGFQKQLWLYDVRSFGLRRILACPCGDIRAVAFSHDDRLLACGGRNGLIRMFDLADGAELLTFAAHRQRIRAVTFSRDDRRLVTCGEDCSISVWNASSGAAEFTLATPGKVMAMVAHAPDRLATGGTDNCVTLWDLARKRRIARLKGHSGSVVALDYHAGILVSGAYDATVRVWPMNEELLTRVTTN